MKSQKLNLNLSMLQSILLGSSLLLMTAPAFAAKTTDMHGNVGYDTSAECDAAVLGGTAKLYQSFTTHPPLKRDGEASVKSMPLSDVTTSNYSRGACDLGVGRSFERDGVSTPLVGKYVPYAPAMPVNVYFDNQNKVVRVSMKQCDNNFEKNLPRPVPTDAIASNKSECFVTVSGAAKFESRSESVLKTAAYKRYEVIPATFKAVEDKVMVSPQYIRQVPVPATYKTITEDVEVSATTFREEPIPATYKVVKDQILVKPESKRFEIIPETYKTVTEQVALAPARKEIKVTPAVYADKEETVVDRPASTRVETVPVSFKTVTEQVIVRPESVSYESIALPMRTVSEKVLLSEAGARLESTGGTYRTVTERVLVKEPTTRLIEVPAVYETVTERIKVADSSTEWKRGSAWLSKAITTRSAKNFKVGADGRVDGSRVDTSSTFDKVVMDAKTGEVISTSKTSGSASKVSANAKTSKGVDDDLMCLVQIPERFETITRQVIKTPASVRTEIVPAVYSTVTRQEIDREATTRKVDIPASYQTITHQEVDIDKLRAQGYKFDDAGNIVATPTGERVLRASQVANSSSSASADSGGSANTGSASSSGSNGKADASADAADSSTSASNANQVATSASGGAKSGLEAYVREVKIPAEYRTETRQVVDQAASARTIQIAGTVQKVKRRVLVSEAKSEEITIPATFQTITRQVIDKPASTREIVIPAEYKTVDRRAVDVAASTRQIPVAAVTEKVARRVIDVPATTRDEVVPAVYKTETRQVLDRPASTREIEVPAQYETLTTQVKTVDATPERRAIMCETNATPAKITEIQRALKTAGFNPGNIDGKIHAETVSAINRFQIAKKLPVDAGGRYLNIDTVKALGVSPN